VSTHDSRTPGNTQDPTAAVAFDPFVPTGPRDRRLALHATGILAQANAVGWVEAADVHVADRLAGLVGDEDDSVLLALALTVRAAREGSSCLDPVAALDGLRRAAQLPRDGDPGEGGHDPAVLAELHQALPTTADEWLAEVGASACVGAGVVQVEHGLIYLDRYHREEVLVAEALAARTSGAALPVDTERLEAGLLRVFQGETWAEQKAAVREAAARSTTILVGGPGTGKTSTVAGLLALLVEQSEGVGRAPTIALAAPTGKAAARLRESVLDAVSRFTQEDRARVGDVEAVTLHRLLGWRRDSSTRFQRDRTNPLPHDIVVVDEASMLSLTMTARLLDALRPSARLVLVGDPDQLASVEAGAVLADLVAGYAATDHTAARTATDVGEAPRSPVSRLLTSHRFGTRIGDLATAVRAGDADEVMRILRSAPGPESDDASVSFIDVSRPEQAHEALEGHLVPRAERLRRLALDGDVAAALRTLDEHRLLCAHRDGPWGVSSWNARVERWLSETSGFHGRQHAGRPLLVTANDYRLGLSNGDTGIVVLGEEGRLVAVFGDPDAPTSYGASTVADAETAHAMTIHKSQGSQAEHITVLLPDAESRLLTRELLYTGLTRAKDRVTIVGSEESVRGAVGRRTARASGLRHRL
jgi:exodeoxyribonuclease V alpha subunit